MSEAHSHNSDEYLMTIYLLANPLGEYLPSRSGPQPTAPARIADQLGVSRAAVGEMLKRLEADGMITRGDKKEAILTEAGSREAERVSRRHRIVERLLTDVMGFTAPESHEKTDGLDDGFTDEMIDRLFERLGKPERCPHGYPIDPVLERDENPTLRPLAELDAGTRAIVVRLAEHDAALLRHYYEIGLAPGTAVTLTTLPNGDSDGFVCTRDADATTVPLNATEASGVFVRPEGAPVVLASPGR